jgi:hypothetical protein
MWIEDYIEKLHSDGMLKGARVMGASHEMETSNWDEQVVAGRANVPTNSGMFAAELKKINYNLCNLVDLKGKKFISLQPFVLLCLLWASFSLS